MNVVIDDLPKDEASAEIERPPWLPENFHTPEALAKSYAHAQAELTKKSQQLAELARENEKLSEELEGLLASRQVLAERISSLERAYIAGIAGVVR